MMDMSKLAGLFAGEALGTFLLAHVFGVIALYNAGISRNFLGTDSVGDAADDDDDGDLNYYYQTGTNWVFPPWAQALAVFIGVFLVYRVGSSLAKRHIHLNPFVSTVLTMREYNSDKEGTFGAYFFTLVWLWISQLVGTAAGASLVYALSYDGSFGGIAQFLGGDGSTTTSQLHIAGVVDVAIGTIGLAILSYFVYDATMKAGGKCDYQRYGLMMGGFYFLYMLIFWVHSKATVDFFRTGSYCFWAEFDEETSNCSQASDFIDVDGGLFLWNFVWQAVIIVLLVVIGATAKCLSEREGYQRMQQAAPERAVFSGRKQK